MKENKFIYLDNAATTSPHKDVVALYNEIALNHFGNASSIHALGVDAYKYLSLAKEKILRSFNLNDHKVIFTSGATEANNLAIKGIAFKYMNRGKHLITSKIEHPSVLETFHQLENEFGFTVTYLDVDNEGVINLEQLKKAINDKTTLVSIMAINNEVGTIEPIEKIADIVHAYPKAILHVDMTQAVGKIDFDFNKIDLFSFSAHKIHGLKGSGALLYKSKLSFQPLLNGGDQEYGFRSGTNDVASACALSKAVEISKKVQKKNHEHVNELNLYLRDLLKDEGIIFNSPTNASPYILNFSLLNKKASVVVEALSRKGIYISSVSACHSKKEPHSYVVEAMSKNIERAKNTIRVSFSYENTKEDVEEFAHSFKEIVRSIR